MPNTTRFTATLSIIALLAVATSSLACAGTTRTVLVAKAPPAPRVEIRRATPGPDHVWVAGYWKWSGRNHVWVNGTWVKKPHRGAAWVPGHWQKLRGGWKWIPGHWR